MDIDSVRVHKHAKKRTLAISSFIIWLAPWVGEMNQITRCDWLPERTTRCIPQAKFPQKPYNKSFIDQVCSVKMAGYWPCSFFVSLWTSTSSRSINTQEKILANIQPSWPHTWSITHTYYMASSASGQDERNRRLWLATRAGKMERSCPLGTARWIPQAKLPQKPYNKSFIDQVCSVKRAGYWPRSFFASL